MKNLAFMLAIGLLWVFLAGSGEPHEVEPNQEFPELCGHDYVQKVSEICGGLDWKSFHPFKFDSIYGSGDKDDSKEPHARQVSRLIDDDQSEQPWSDSGNGQPDEEGILHQNETDDSKVNASQAEPEEDRKVQILLPTTNYRTKLTAGPLSTKCCETSCTTDDIRQLC